ncbi:MAG: NERD domain-containing protein [Rhodobacter sp.]|nr:NERD domain-containing protein [Rhodobacter sp.]
MPAPVVGVDDLREWNGIEDPDLLLAGQEILVRSPAEGAGTAVPENPESRAETDFPTAAATATGSRDMAVGGAADIWLGAVALRFPLLALLLFLPLLRKRRAAPPPPRSPSPRQPQSVPWVNDGERLVSAELGRRYPDWIPVDNVMFPSGRGTTQIDHILVSPNAVFPIETRDMNGWVFGGPGDREWTRSYRAGFRSRGAGVRSKRFRFHNPLRQNGGHAESPVRPGVVGHWRDLRPMRRSIAPDEVSRSRRMRPALSKTVRVSPWMSRMFISIRLYSGSRPSRRNRRLGRPCIPPGSATASVSA